MGTTYIPADDEDIDEDSIPAYSHPAPSSGRIEQDATPTSDGQSKGKGRSGGETTPRPNALSGNIGSSNGPTTGAKASTRQSIGGVQFETRYAGIDTLDEPVMTTIARDLLSIYSKLIQVLYPKRTGSGREVLKDWDLWGPLILCLALGIMLSLNAPQAQALGIFTGVVVIVSVGSLIVTLNAKLLGGRVSFFQSLCVLGYCIFPLVLAALVSTFVRILWVRIPVALLAWGWCVWASVNFLDGTKIEQQRVLLAVYPLLLFYFILAWMILVL